MSYIWIKRGSLRDAVDVKGYAGQPLMLWYPNMKVEPIERNVLATMQSLGFPLIMRPNGRALIGGINEVVATIHRALAFHATDSLLGAYHEGLLDGVQIDTLGQVFLLEGIHGLEL